MKTIIALTSSFLAGAAIAASADSTWTENASCVDTSSWSSLGYTLITNSNSTVDSSSSTSLSSGRAGFQSLTLNGTTLSSVSASSYSWQVSFNLASDVSSYSGMCFSSGESGVTSGNGAGYSIGITGSSTDSEGNTTYSFAVKTGTDAWANKTVGATISGCALTDTISLTWDAAGSVLYFSVGNQTVSLSNATMNALSLATTTYSDISSTYPNNTIFWTNGGAQKMENISVKAFAIPEPSMFGLLAGLGALALAGTRRRRK